MRAAVIALIGFTCATPLAQAQHQDASVKLVEGLPSPTGTFPIGRRHFEWSDPARKSSATRSRVVIVSVFYPSVKRSVSHAVYLQGARKLPINEKTAFLRDSFGAAWRLIAADKLRSHTTANAPILQMGKKLPVLLFSPGLGMASAAYSVQLEDLASHGYVVVAIDHPYDSPLLALSDGTLIPFDKKTWSEHQLPGPPTLDGIKFGLLRQADWVTDSSFVIQELRSRSTTSFFDALDLTHVGAFGHSFGGIVAAKLCQTDSMIQACMNEDGELFGRTLKPDQAAPSLDPALPLKKPVLIFTLVEPEMKRIPEYMQLRKASRDDLEKFLNTQTSSSYLIAIDRPDMRHTSFTDIPLLYEDSNRAGSLQLSEFTSKVACAFFDQFLRGDVSNRLDKVLSDNPIGTVVVFPR
jgi:Platelet-activating factor acetylhydrolase, isoform II